MFMPQLVIMNEETIKRTKKRHVKEAFKINVRCKDTGSAHEIALTPNGRIVTLHHSDQDIIEDLALEVLGAKVRRCADVIATWRDGDKDKLPKSIAWFRPPKTHTGDLIADRLWKKWCKHHKYRFKSANFKEDKPQLEEYLQYFKTEFALLGMTVAGGCTCGVLSITISLSNNGSKVAKGIQLTLDNHSHARCSTSGFGIVATTSYNKSNLWHLVDAVGRYIFRRHVTIATQKRENIRCDEDNKHLKILYEKTMHQHGIPPNDYGRMGPSYVGSISNRYLSMDPLEHHIVVPTHYTENVKKGLPYILNRIARITATLKAFQEMTNKDGCT